MPSNGIWVGVMKERVLIAEDDDISFSILQRILENESYEVIRARNGYEAINLLKPNHFPIMLLDLNMPEISGYQVLEETRRMETPPVVIIQTSDNDIQSIIRNMRAGAFDYILKPVNPEELVFKAGRAMEVFHIRALQNHLHTDSIEESARKADAHAAPQKLSLKNLHRYTKTLFESLQTNFNQGAGIGMLISLVSLLMMQAKKEGSNYVVPAETMDLILQNASMAEKALNRINELHFLQDRDLEVVPFSREQVHKMLQEIIASVEPFGKIKNHRIHLADNDVFFDKGELRLNRSLFSQALQEILINAFKFSLENTDVYVIYGAMDKILSLSILNSPHSKDLRQSGFVNDLNQIIFEPFFREEKAVDERFATLDYGLGLTYAKVIIERHGGTISASSVQDDRISPEQLVSIDIELPLIASEERDDSVMRF